MAWAIALWFMSASRSRPSESMGKSTLSVRRCRQRLPAPPEGEPSALSVRRCKQRLPAPPKGGAKRPLSQTLQAASASSPKGGAKRPLSQTLQAASASSPKGGAKRPLSQTLQAAPASSPKGGSQGYEKIPPNLGSEGCFRFSRCVRRRAGPCRCADNGCMRRHAWGYRPR